MQSSAPTPRSGLARRSTRVERMDAPRLLGDGVRNGAHGTRTPDGPGVSARELAASLQRIGSFTRGLGGVRAVARELARHPGQTLLDVGTGNLALPVALRRRVPGAGLLIGLDHHADVVHVAGTKDRVGVPVIHGDGLALPFADGAIDVVVSTLTLHHLSDDHAVRFLIEMKRVARRTVYVWDLNRTRTALFGASVLANTVWRTDPMVRHDATLSVRRAFRPSEVRALAARAGLADAEVRPLWPARWELRASMDVAP